MEKNNEHNIFFEDCNKIVNPNLIITIGEDQILFEYSKKNKISNPICFQIQNKDKKIALKKILESISNFRNIRWAKITLIINNNKHIIIPENMFDNCSIDNNNIFNDEINKKSFITKNSFFKKLLNVSTKIDESNDEIRIAKIEKLKILSLFAIDKKIKSVVDDFFFPKNIDALHQGNKSIDIIKSYHTVKQRLFSTHIYVPEDKTAYITVFEKENLKYHNRFELADSNDILYYIDVTLAVLKIPKKENNIKLYFDKLNNIKNKVQKEIKALQL